MVTGRFATLCQFPTWTFRTFGRFAIPPETFRRRMTKNFLQYRKLQTFRQVAKRPGRYIAKRPGIETSKGVKRPGDELAK